VGALRLGQLRQSRRKAREMAIIDVEHIELYVADAHAAADF
jgi:hypothetical protein